MIHDSNPWKKELLQTAAWLQRLRLTERTREETHIKLEKAVFFAAYAIRKLVEARKLSDAVVSYSIDLEFFPAKRQVTMLNWGHFDRNYDFESPGAEVHDLVYVCNQLIHSFAFAPEVAEDGRLAAVLVASDKRKSTKLYRVARGQLLGLMRLVGRDNPSEMQYYIDEAGKEHVSLRRQPRPRASGRLRGTGQGGGPSDGGRRSERSAGPSLTASAAAPPVRRASRTSR